MAKKSRFVIRTKLEIRVAVPIDQLDVADLIEVFVDHLDDLGHDPALSTTLVSPNDVEVILTQRLRAFSPMAASTAAMSAIEECLALLSRTPRSESSAPTISKFVDQGAESVETSVARELAPA